ncbi:MAG: bifunctional 3,4-dihydroxy-2-butanone-4-phosphate synthase/GTP cyclohydrolase II [Gemmatimonas sp.]|nr:bifunctional 3,4-dihydroxy-2-butanone-4-phosphate synthase/GTP cyclohydrolase II [Gemmatimonas sp.]
MPFATIDQALHDLRTGKFIVVADDEDRENEGDLVLAAEFITSEKVNFLMQAKGMICVALSPARVAQLDLPMMGSENTDALRTAYTVTIDAVRRYGVTTGISAADQAATIRRCADPLAVPSDFRRPGHVHPLCAREGGVLERVGHTEAAVDLMRLAGLQPAGVICEILTEDGSTAKRPQLEEFCEKHGLTFMTVAQLVAHRLQTERLVHRVAEARLPTEFGEFNVIGYRNDVDDREHVALVMGEVEAGEDVLVRMHSKCLTGDTFHSLRCDCRWQLHEAMRLVTEAGRGVIVYLDQEGRGIGLLNKLKAYELQDRGADTVEANEKLGFAPDLRNYGIGAQILLDLGLKSIRPITNNPKKLVGLEGYGLRLGERVPIISPATTENANYLETKVRKLGHLRAM